MLFLIGIMTGVLPYGRSQPVAGSYPQLDTLETYNVSLVAHYGDKDARYFVDGEEVEKRIYDRYAKLSENFVKCKPCILKAYDVNNVLASISIQYLDCAVGTYTTFYPNGRVKMKGQYKQNDSGNWSKLHERGYCSVAEGEWYYYSQWGHLLRVEKYVEGKLVDTK